MGSVMIVPVTVKMSAELHGAARLIRMLEGHKVNDHSHFQKTVDQLENLTLSVLAATSSTSLVTRTAPTTARFNIDSGGHLNGHIIACVAYLRDTVSEQLRVGGFMRYNSEHTGVALGYLKKLEGMIRSAIVKAAEADLATLSSSGINDLLIAAAALAKAAAPAPLPAEDVPATDES